MSIGENVKKYRNAKKLTQKELADKANISRSYLADVENNRYNPSIDVLKSIADALNVSIDKFFEDSKGKDNSVINDGNAIDPRIRSIIDSLDRAGDLQDEDIDEIIQQVEFLINLKRKKKSDS